MGRVLRATLSPESLVRQGFARAMEVFVAFPRAGHAVSGEELSRAGNDSLPRIPRAMMRLSAGEGVYAYSVRRVEQASGRAQCRRSTPDSPARSPSLTPIVAALQARHATCGTDGHWFSDARISLVLAAGCSAPIEEGSGGGRPDALSGAPEESSAVLDGAEEVDQVAAPWVVVPYPPPVTTPRYSAPGGGASSGGGNHGRVPPGWDRAS